MIKSIQFVQYKKLKSMSLSFETGLNAVSGENGTCKSSLLYLISNSFQAVTKNCEWVKDTAALDVINTVNAVTNPKIESLQRKSLREGEDYDDPAQGVKGTLYTVEYFGHEPLEFRRHNSRVKDKSRFSLKPKYPDGSTQSLPFCPVIYLGLSRLVPYGEFVNNDAVSPIKRNLPNAFKEAVATNFKTFTGYEIEQKTVQKLEGIKRRSEFVSSTYGIDSNTISAGEDNLYIILAALESLKFYYDSIESRNDIESILLVDEIDATLHPDYQIRLLSLMREYAEKYKIQIVFTTHSMTALEDLLMHNDRVTYLVDNISHVSPMEEPTIEQIKAHLYNKTDDDIYQSKCIPVLTEDAEARFLLDMLFDYYEDNKPEFCRVRRFFSVPDVFLGADNLRGLFKDENLIRSRVGAFCVLDGDKGTDRSSCVISLPGRNYHQITIGQKTPKGLGPEALLFDYAKYLADSDDQFWNEKSIIAKGFSQKYYRTNILNPIEQFDANECKGTNSQRRREFNKKLFNKHKSFFEYVFKKWLHDPGNADQIESFYTDLKIMFNKCAVIRGINPQEWK